MWKYYLLRLALAIAPHIPYTAGAWLADLIGLAIYLLKSDLRKNATDNARHVSPDAGASQIRRITLSMFQSAARNYFDLLRCPPGGKGLIKAKVDAIGLNNLLDTLALGGGAVVIVPHLGSWDLALQVMIERGVRVTLPVERLKPDWLHQIMVERRSREGLIMVEAGGGALREAFRALQRSEIVLIATDRDVLGNGVPVRFFRSLTTLPAAAAVIAARTGAPIIPGFTYRTGHNQYAVEFFPPIDVSGIEQGAAGIEELMTAVCAAMEIIISRHPDQWVALQPVWPKRALN